MTFINASMTPISQPTVTSLTVARPISYITSSQLCTEAVASLRQSPLLLSLFKLLPVPPV